MIYLHIGRNKAGSTTLQAFLAERHRALREAGVHYVNFGHLADSHPEIPGFATMAPLADFARGITGDVLVSNEFMSAWARVYTEAVGEALAGLEVQVLVYLRDYSAWLPSLYAEAVRRCGETRDFSAYAEAMAAEVSAWPMLEGYAAAFGWDRVRVRALDPRCLKGGDIVSDAFHALGRAAPPDLLAAAPPRSNVSPGWMAVEMLRAAHRAHALGDWRGSEADAFRLAARLPVSPSPGEAAAGYLEPDLAARLADLYDRDVSRILACTGTSLPPAARQVPSWRGHAPEWKDVPSSVVRAWADRAGEEALDRDLLRFLLAMPRS